MEVPLKEIKQLLKTNSTLEARTAAEKFVPGSLHVYGVRMPVLNELSGQFKYYAFDLVEALWEQESLEERLLAVKLLERIAKKDPERSLKLVKRFANNLDNWAVCDAIGMQGIKQLRKTHSKEIFALARKYTRSRDPWQRRLALVLVEWYTRDKTFHSRIRQLIDALKHDDAYYVKKAVAWIERNLRKGK